MDFYTPAFLCAFLPVLVGLHTLLKSEKARNWLLLLAGLVLYAFGSLSGVVVLLAFSLLNYVFCFVIRFAIRRAGGRVPLAFAVAADLVFLCFYKYLGFFPGNLLGVSFFTFKCISCLVDTYRNPAKAPARFFDLLLYVSFFPQILAGPIARFDGFSAQLSDRSVDAEQMALGFRRFIIGLGKKLLLAYALAGAVDRVFAMERAHISAALAWLAALAYTLQIFLDFSAYSDMAIGLGQMFGFSAPENFLWPYTASSIGGFWRRWHISLSSWFRDYLYIPLGGSRKGKTRAALNKFVVFTLCGLWHGAALTFLLWGAWHGLLSALETLHVIPVKKLQARPWGRAVLHVYTVLAVCLSFVMFRAANVDEAAKLLSAMFSFGAGTTLSTVTLHSLVNARFIAFFALSVIACFPLGKTLAAWEQRHAALRPLSYVLALALLALSLTAMASQGFQPFIYAQF